jgi:excisionase family DNA binding protein
MLMTFDDAPEMLRVEEVARLLRISRSSAYEAVAAFQVSGGDDGIPSMRIGRSLRVPKAVLLEWINEKAHQGVAVGPADAA